MIFASVGADPGRAEGAKESLRKLGYRASVIFFKSELRVTRPTLLVAPLDAPPREITEEIAIVLQGIYGSVDVVVDPFVERYEFLIPN